MGKVGLKKLSKEVLKKSIDDVAGKLLKTCVFACFPAGTLIQTQHGTKPIEDIQIGDLVWAYDEDTDTTALQPVVDIMENESDHTISLYTEYEIIETTALHPFYTQDGWKDASELQAGDQIKTQNHEIIEIKDTKFNYQPQKVYNFTVANFHTYFVGALAWLVHNAGKCLSQLAKRLPKTKGKWLGEAGESVWKSTKKAVKKIAPDGVPFKNGFPDFSKWSKGKMKFKNLDGTAKDFDKVYERVAKQKGLKNKTQAKKYLKDKGLTPHHHQDGKTIELIPTALHSNVPHSGGASILRNGGI